MSRSGVYFKIFLFLVSFLHITTAKYNVELVQVVFRHGDRTPRKEEIYPKLQYNAALYEYLGYGQLTEVGYVREYRIGTVLRKLYGKFLGNAYHYGVLYATSTDMDRTKMSLELVLTALYQGIANEQYKHPKWLTVPMSYVPTIVDDLLMPQECPMYMEELNRVINLPVIREKISQYNDLYDVVAENTGLNTTLTPLTSICNVYQLLISQRSMHIASPAWVTPDIFKAIEKVVILAAEVTFYTTKLKRLTGGMLIQEFIKNMNSNEEGTKKQKMYLYSAHDTNIMAFAKAHGLKEPEISSYGSAIIVEKLRDNAGSVFVRMMLWTGVTNKLITYTLDGCDEICPISTYLNQVQDVIPTDKESSCLWDSVTKDQLHQYYVK